ncbi:MAG TPA: sialate O-acetylesterase, partial [Polyangia bacterium]|nr:sialate O-acetylesterase [Polyangia bacterium]
MKIVERALLVLSTSLACLSISTPAMAAVTLGGLFSDHMVVQREMEVPVWGTDTANQSITVKLGTQQATGTAGADGKFTVRLPAQAAGGPFSMTVTGSSTVTVADVYVGEVWLGSGQSNMGYTMQCGYAGCAMKDAATEIAAANYPLIRTTNVPGRPSATPVANTSTTVKSTWLVVSPQTAPGISAIGYFFSRELFKNLNGVAIGFVHSSAGGSCLQCWMSKESIAAIPSVASDLASFEANPNYTNVHNPYICYNGMIAPLIPYAIRGVVWYQGESVTWGAYRDIQVGLISSWRQAWGQDFTFLITQLPNYNISSTGWPVLREAQLQASQILPNTGISVNIDIGDPNYVHPSDKPDQGLRLGMAARGLTYGQTDFAYYSPIYDRMAIEGSSIRLYFTHAETGLAF